MQIAILGITKDINSTYAPDLTNATWHEVRLKERTSVLQPTFIYHASNIAELTKANYIVCKEFTRSYWIVNYTVVTNEIIEFECKVDVLGTYRTEILGSTQFVMRSESHYNTRYTDSVLPSEANVYETYDTQNISEFRAKFPEESGFFVLGVSGSDSSFGSTFYIMSIDVIKKFMGYVFQASNFPELVNNAVSKMYFNPLEYITTCIYFPNTFDHTSSNYQNVSEIKLGFYSWTVSLPSNQDYCKVIKNSTQCIYKVYEYAMNVQLPYPTDKLNFRNFAPYTMYKLFLPFRGTIDLPNGLMGTDSPLNIATFVDLTSGKAYTDLYFNTSSGGRKFIQREEYQIGVQIPITFIDNSPKGQVLSGFSGAVEEAYNRGKQAEGGVLDGLKAYGGSLLDSLSEGVDKMIGVVNHGSNFLSGGGMKLSVGGVGEAIYNYQIILITLHQSLPTLPLNTFGAPLLEPKRLQDLNGYCEVQNPEVKIGRASQTEILAIQNFMKGGFRIV